MTKTYIDDIFKQYKQNNESLQLKEELEGVLEDSYNEYLKKGLKEEQAMKMAINDMGDIHVMLKNLPMKSEKLKCVRIALSILAIFMILLGCIAAVYTYKDTNRAYLSASVFYIFGAIPFGILLWVLMTKTQDTKVIIRNIIFALFNVFIAWNIVLIIETLLREPNYRQIVVAQYCVILFGILVDIIYFIYQVTKRNKEFGI